MIRIRRGPAPAELRKRQSAWTERWKRIRSQRLNAPWATDSAKTLLQTALDPLAHGKCAFCESTLGVTTYLEIEHYIAKSVNPEKTFEWENLLPACRLCNGAKGDADHQGRLLKPDAEDPEPFFWLHPEGKLEPHPNLDDRQRRRAEETIRLLDLQRGPLCENRMGTRRLVTRWLERAGQQGRTVLRELREEWESLVDPRAEYKLVIRRTLELAGQPDLAEEDRRRFRG